MDSPKRRPKRDDSKSPPLGDPIRVSVPVAQGHETRQMENIAAVFRIVLWQIRRASGLDQKAFAEKLGMSVSSYNSMENGKHEPTLTKLAPIFAALQEFPDEFFARFDRPSHMTQLQAKQRKHDDEVFRSFRTILSADLAERLVRVLYALDSKRDGGLVGYIRNGELIAGLDSPPDPTPADRNSAATPIRKKSRP